MFTCQGPLVAMQIMADATQKPKQKLSDIVIAVKTVG